MIDSRANTAIGFSAHVAIEVSDRKSAVTFLMEVLNMNRVSETNSETHLSIDGINFFVEEEKSLRTHFEFSTSNLTDTVAVLNKRGCTLRTVHTPEFNISYMVETPFGFCFHLFEKKQ